MDPNTPVQNFNNNSTCGYQPLFIIQNKQSPLLLQRVYSFKQPAVITEESTENSTLKTFYENSLNVVGQVNAAIVPDSDSILSSNQSPNVEEYLINPVKQVKTSQNVMELPKSKKTVNIAPAKRKADVLINPTVKEKKKPPIQRTNVVTTNSHSSVHLLKVGNKYLSMNHLSEEQLKLVKQALENIGDPEKDALKPTYDATTNTKITYKVISPNDLKVVGKNKIVISKRTNVDPKKANENTIPANSENKAGKEEPVKITRSGRKVKIPKHIDGEIDNIKTVPLRNKKKLLNAQCFMCSNEFSSVYRLQQHYELHPSHIPSNTHNSIYHCLLSIINTTNEDEKVDVFLQQLQDFVAKLKTSMPCMLKKVDGVEGKMCMINDEIARIFGLNPGKYNLNIDAISCINRTKGQCEHNTQKPQIFNTDLNKPSQVWLSKHIEETANENLEVCARTNSIDKWLPFTKRCWKYKKSILDKSKLNSNKETEVIQIADDINNTNPINIHNNEFIDLENTVPSLQLNSTSHFDLQTPIQNQPNEVFSPFKLNLGKIAKYDAQTLRPELFAESAKSDNSLDGILQHLTSKTTINSNSLDIIDELNCKTDERCFERTKNWTIDNIQSQDSYQTNACIQPTMIHIKDTVENTEPIIKDTNEIDGVLNLSDTLISEPLNDCLNFSELRHSSIEDLPLDLFNFNNP